MTIALGLTRSSRPRPQRPTTASLHDDDQIVKVGDRIRLGPHADLARARERRVLDLVQLAAVVVDLKQIFVGYEPQTLTEVRVDAGKPTQVEFRLKKGIAGMVQNIIVKGQKHQVDVKSSSVEHIQTDKEILSLPVTEGEEISPAIATACG